MEKNSKNIFYIFLLLIFLNSIYNISLNFNNLGFESLSNIIFFLSLSLILFIPYINNLNRRNNFIEDNINKELDLIERLTDLSKNNYKVISNFYLKNGYEKIQFDLILVFENKIINIILCNKDDIACGFKINNNLDISYRNNLIKKINKMNVTLKNNFDNIKVESDILILDDINNINFSQNEEILIFTLDNFIDYIKSIKDTALATLNKCDEKINYIDNPFSIRQKYDSYGVKNNFVRIKILVSLIFVFLYLYNK